MAQTVTEVSNSQTESMTEARNEDNADRSPTIGQPTEELDLDAQLGPAIAEDESQYPTGTKLNLILLSMGLVLIVGGMDSSIVAIAVPVLTDHWHTVADIAWYSAAYRLSTCSFQFMFSKLYKLFGVKRIFLTSQAIFIIGSTICAAAPSSTTFILGRAVSGFANAGIIAGCFALLVQLMPLRKRPLYTGIFGAVEGIASIAAPVLGGVLVQVNWRWCFIINIPLGVVVLILLMFLVQNVRTVEQTSWKHRLRELDLIGNLVLVPSLTCLFMALSWAGIKYPWNSPTVITLLCVFVILLAAFAVDQWLKQDSATLPPRVLKNRSVIAGFVFSLCCNSALNVVEYYLPTWLQAVKEYSPSKSGFLVIPMIAGFLLAMLAHGAGVNILGYYAPFMLAGSILMPVFAGLMTTLTVDTGIGELIAFSAFLGIAGGIGFQAPQVAVQNTLPAADANMGLAIIIFAQSFGPAVFISAAQTIFTNQLSTNLKQLAPDLNATRIENMGLSDIKAHIGPKNLHDVLVGFDKSLVQTWYIAVGLTCLTMVGSASMEWKSVKQKRR